MIPHEIPERFRSSAIIPEFARDHEAVWILADAIEVIRALAWTRIAILGVQGCTMIAGSLVPTNDAWAFPGTFGETESRRARKSHAAALRFIESLAGKDADYVALEFSYQDEAA